MPTSTMTEVLAAYRRCQTAAAGRYITYNTNNDLAIRARKCRPTGSLTGNRNRWLCMRPGAKWHNTGAWAYISPRGQRRFVTFSAKLFVGGRPYKAVGCPSHGRRCDEQINLCEQTTPPFGGVRIPSNHRPTHRRHPSHHRGCGNGYIGAFDERAASGQHSRRLLLELADSIIVGCTGGHASNRCTNRGNCNELV